VSFVALTMEANGSYFALEKFLANLEQLQRALLVNGVAINGGGSSGSESEDQRVLGFIVGGWRDRCQRVPEREPGRPVSVDELAGSRLQQIGQCADFGRHEFACTLRHPDAVLQLDGQPQLARGTRKDRETETMSSFDWGTDRTSDSAGSGSQESGGPVPQPGGSDPAGGRPTRGLVVGVLTALFVVALGWFVVRPMLTGTTGSPAAAPATPTAMSSAPAEPTAMSSAPAEPTATATPSSSESVAGSAAPTAAGTGTPRNPFVPLVTPSVSSSLRPTSEAPAQPSGSIEPTPTPSPAPTQTPPIGLGRASSPAASPAPSQPNAAEGAVSPHGTLALTAISSAGGSVSAEMTWKGGNYRAQPGEQFTKYLTLVDVSGKQARFSYRDKPFTLGLHQKHTF
jgi:hypothetical protein